MSIWSKIGIGAVIILILAAFFWVLKQQSDIIQEQRDAITEMKQLGEGIARAQSQYVSKEDLAQMAESINLNLALIQKDLAGLDSKVVSINNFLIKTPGYKGTGIPSTGTTPGPKPPECTGEVCSDPYGNIGNKQTLKLNEPIKDGQSIPFGSVDFQAWERNPWSLEVYPRIYSATTVIGEDVEGKQYAYNQFTVESNGEKVTLPITQSTLIQERPKPSFIFNPRLQMGADGGLTVNPTPRAEFIPNLQVTLFSYGQTKTSPVWSFAGVGLGYEVANERPAVVITPAEYNVGTDLPLIDNLHVGPSLTVDTNSTVGISMGMKVGL